MRIKILNYDRSYRLLITLAGVCTVITVVCMSNIGAMAVSWHTIWANQDMHALIFWNVRLPRVLAAILVGGAFAISGAIMQGLFRNPLVESGIIGVSSGAALFASLAIVLGQAWLPTVFLMLEDYALPIAACVGGWFVTGILYYFSRHNQSVSVSSMLLLGIAINAFTGAMIGIINVIADDTQLRSLTFWSLGSLGGFTWQKITLLMIVHALIVPFILMKTQQINILLLGERPALHLGIDIERLKKQQIFAVAILTGTAVAFSGGIGFIGLLIPHLIRMLFGSDHRLVLPLSYLSGGILLCLADGLARTIVAPSEIPIGIFTALMGAPFLAFLVYKQTVSNRF